MDISIVVPSYRSFDTIERCLQSLVSQKTKLSYEIIVVDSSGDEKTSDIVKTFPRLELVRLPVKAYASAASNAGASRAKGELLAFIDADVILPPGWLEDAFAYYKSGHDVFCGAIDIWDAKNASVINKLEWFYVSSEFKPLMKEGRRWCLPAAALCIKKSIFDEDPFLEIKNSHDMELTLRLSEKGHALYFNPRLKVEHIFRDSYAGILRKADRFGHSNMRVRGLHKIPGSAAMHNKILAIFATPFFAAFKFIKISWRNIRYNGWGNRFIYIMVMPLMAAVMFSWMIGAYSEELSTGSGQKNG